MAAIIVSTLVFFVAGFFIKRKLEDMDIPAGMTRNILVFSLASLLSYIAAVLVDKL
jgi:hypothetical protein